MCGPFQKRCAPLKGGSPQGDLPRQVSVRLLSFPVQSLDPRISHALNRNQLWSSWLPATFGAIFSQSLTSQPTVLSSSSVRLVSPKSTVIKSNHQIHHLSCMVELKAGDLIFMGTPHGWGPLVPGDAVEGGLEGVGTIKFSVTE